MAEEPPPGTLSNGSVVIMAMLAPPGATPSPQHCPRITDAASVRCASSRGLCSPAAPWGF